MKILAIDTSCDETSVAVTDGTCVLSNVVSSQVRYHKKYGGVVPMLAGRLHTERIDAVIELALRRGGLNWSNIEAIAVTYGPGLAPALQVGIAKAKQLATEKNLPLYAVNHMAGHIASCFAQVGSKSGSVPLYPSLVLLVSGSHSELVIMSSFGNFQIIGQTLDDALGEAYDKVGRMLGLGYPGGHLVSQFADESEPIYELPVAMTQSGDLNLSYSGLKNAVRLLIQELKELNGSDLLTREQITGVCASFQKVAQKSVLNKVERALSTHPELRQLVLGGGVAANMVLRKKLRKMAAEHQIELVVPANRKLCSDNAAMIGVAAWLGKENDQRSAKLTTLDRVPYLTLEETQFFE